MWAALAQAPSGTYETASAFDGIRRLFTYRQVGDLPLVMVVGFSAGDLTDRVVARIGWLWPVAGIITLLIPGANRLGSIGPGGSGTARHR